ncbi:hypothetical protein EJB05_49337, partial [Eragrostis curvula]
MRDIMLSSVLLTMLRDDSIVGFHLMKVSMPAVSLSSCSSKSPMSDSAFVILEVQTIVVGSEMDDYEYDEEEVSGHSERYGRRSPMPFDLDVYMAERQQDTLCPS